MSIESAISTKDLLEAVAESGHSLTSHQLKRLRLNGLVATPAQSHQIGVGGSQTVYTVRDLDQLLGVLRLRDHHGLSTYRDLRVAAWLAGWNVDFTRLRPDVVAVLRSAIHGQQRLRKGSEDDDLSRRLRSALTTMPRRQIADINDELFGSDQSENPDTFEAMALTSLQLVASTPHAEAGRDRLDAIFNLENEQGDSITDLYLHWDIPAMDKWPRSISRLGARWFNVGRDWLELVTALLIDSVASNAASTPTQHVSDRLDQRIPDHSNVEERTLLACQGMELARNNANELLAAFDTNSP